MNRQQQKKQQKAYELMVADFNKKYPVGTKVAIRKDFSEEATITETRDEAFIACSGHPVIFLKGVSGYYDLQRVMPITQESEAA